MQPAINRSPEQQQQQQQQQQQYSYLHSLCNLKYLQSLKLKNGKSARTPDVVKTNRVWSPICSTLKMY